jgi:hypothetical protein
VKYAERRINMHRDCEGTQGYWLDNCTTNATIRVFPRRTNMTPKDIWAFVGDPPMDEFRPPRDDVREVHISCTFTWDIDKAFRLQDAWNQYYYPVVKIGGPAFSDRPAHSVKSKYLKPNVITSSYGCNNNCPWCLVPLREGKLVERDLDSAIIGALDGTDLIYIQDNSLAQCSHGHIHKLFKLLRWYSVPIEFSGGIDPNCVDDWLVDELRSLRIHQIFLACDTDHGIRPLERAVKKLHMSQNKVRCYVMLAYNGETMDKGVERLKQVYAAGAIPFAQLYQPPDEYIEYSKEWRDLARAWSRPAITKSIMKEDKVGVSCMPDMRA